MKNPQIKILNSTDKEWLQFIAETHESLPADWIDNYVVSEEEVFHSLGRLLEKLKNESNYCAVIQNDNEIVSYIWAEVNSYNPKQIDIVSLWTKEEYRGQGLAEKLKIALESWSLEMGAEKIHTTVSRKNKQMVSLNEKLGYEIEYLRMTKHLKDY